MRHRRLALLACLTGVLLAVAACGEDGYSFVADNQSDSTVYVTFRCNTPCPGKTTFEVPPHAYGMTLSDMGSGSFTGDVQIVDAACDVIWEQDHFSGTHGTFQIAADSTVTALETIGEFPDARPTTIPSGVSDC